MNTLEKLNSLSLNYDVDIDILTKIYNEKFKGNEDWFEEVTAKLDSLKYKMLTLVYDDYETDEYFIYTNEYKDRIEKYKSYIQNHISEI